MVMIGIAGDSVWLMLIGVINYKYAHSVLLTLLRMRGNIGINLASTQRVHVPNN